jgi:hypothetical protein
LRKRFVNRYFFFFSPVFNSCFSSIYSCIFVKQTSRRTNGTDPARFIKPAGMIGRENDAGKKQGRICPVLVEPGGSVPHIHSYLSLDRETVPALTVFFKEPRDPSQVAHSISPV